MTPADRATLIHRFAAGPDLLEQALAKVPEPARKWRPAPGKWSVHEVIVHCADSEANAHMRIRYLVSDPNPLIIGYDQDYWAIDMLYHEHPLEPALATVRAVRANTVPLLMRMTEAQWAKTGRHTEHPSYGAEKWLETYADHLEVHARQIAQKSRGVGEEVRGEGERGRGKGQACHPERSEGSLEARAKRWGTSDCSTPFSPFPLPHFTSPAHRTPPDPPVR